MRKENTQEIALVAANDAANDNEPVETRVKVLLPEDMGIVAGEVELVASFFSQILAHMGNDNWLETSQNPGPDDSPKDPLS